MGEINTKLKIKKIIINKNIRLISIGITCILLIVMGILLINILSKGKFVDKKIPGYTYNNKAKVNYQVFLIPNNLFPADQKSIGEDNIYVKKLVNYIETNFTYEFNGQTPAQVQGKYSISAILEGQLGSDKAIKTVWKYEEQLLSEKNFIVNDSKYILEVKSQIKPQYFQQLATTRSSEYEINFNTKLTIYWNIQIEAKTDKGIIKETLMPTMEIPINTEKYFEIKGNLITEKKGALETITTIISPTYKSKLLLFSVGCGICIFSLLFIFFFTESKPKDNALQLKLKNIFKKHGDRLVRLVDEQSISMVQLVLVEDFEDLVRIADDVGKPIFYRDKENTNEISTFYVFDGGYVYVLKLKMLLM